MYTGVETFGAIVKHRAEQHPDKRFIRIEAVDLTYQQFHRNGNRFAHAVRALGLDKGQTCATMLPTCPELLFSWLGLARAGVMEVPINIAFRGHSLAHILNTAQCQALVISAEWLDRIQDLADDLHNLKHLIIVGGEPPAEGIGDFACHDFDKLVNGAPDSDIDADIKPTDASLILFTSGTTGPSKGAVLTHRCNFRNGQTCVRVMQYGPDDRLFTVFPLYHANARYTSVLAAMLADCEVVIHNRFSASRFWDICREENITAFNFMGSVVSILMKQPESPNDRSHRVRKAFGGPTPLDLFDAFEKRFGVKISEIYGLTELGTLTVNPSETFRKGSFGKAVDFYEVEIHDDEDLPCPPGTVGEIVVRPREPGIMLTGYYGMPEAMVHAMKNMWFHTGDRGYMDEDGYFYFVDRKKDSIRRRGENVSSFEVETVINEHPKVLDSAVVGVPSELGEEEVMAVVIVNAGETLAPEELLDFCQPRMPYFAVPRFIRFVGEFPRTPSQRIEKYKLREQGITADTWDREKTGYKVVRA